MNVFAVVSAPPLPSQELGAMIAAAYPNGDFLKVSDEFWLVADTGIAKDISDKIGISQAPGVSAVVLSFNGYYGRAANHIWEWIALKTSAKVFQDAPTQS